MALLVYVKKENECETVILNQKRNQLIIDDDVGIDYGTVALSNLKRWMNYN